MDPATHGCKRSIVYGGKVIDYNLLFCNRKTMEIAVHPDSSVVAKAPIGADITLVEKKISKRARWILRQLDYFSQFNPKTPDRCYVNGETHFYLGRQYRLRLTEGTANEVKLTRGFFHVTATDFPTPEIAKKLLNKWYLEKAQFHFQESMDRCWLKFDRFDFVKPAMKIRRMQKRWGSFSGKGTVTLNTALIRAPKECIDYVITHELCHMKYQDHGPDFYKLLERVIPGWEKIKHKLELGMR
ncbi:MAG TPA: M48 family peptidase [Dehalococcoidia bacterium]|nr:M48 family peptidase [Dehalococcoidia bacterium]